jgi:excisionase family DNA binding protein
MATHTPSVAHVTGSLTACADTLAHLEDVPLEQLAALLGQIAALQQAVSARLLHDLLLQAEVRAHETDRLLTVTEAAQRLACSKDWLYRHRLPFAVRNGRQLRFSADGLERYIRQRAGRETTSLSRRTEP